MPLDPNQMASSIQACGASTLRGPQFQLLATAISNATTTWALSSVVVGGVSTGALGSGTATGSILLVPNPAVFKASCPTLSGVLGGVVSNAICLGVAASVNSNCRYIGVSPSVGVGVDVSRVVLSDPGTLIPILTSNLRAFTFTGIQSQILSAELSVALAGLFITGIGVGGIVTGVGTGPPSTSITTSRLA
jgi:hypothetical protein